MQLTAFRKRYCKASGKSSSISGGNSERLCKRDVGVNLTKHKCPDFVCLPRRRARLRKFASFKCLNSDVCREPVALWFMNAPCTAAFTLAAFQNFYDLKVYHDCVLYAEERLYF